MTSQGKCVCDHGGFDHKGNEVEQKRSERRWEEEMRQRIDIHILNILDLYKCEYEESKEKGLEI